MSSRQTGVHTITQDAAGAAAAAATTRMVLAFKSNEYLLKLSRIDMRCSAEPYRANGKVVAVLWLNAFTPQ